MTEPRPPAVSEGAEESGAVERVRPVEILPRLHGVDVKEGDRELALEVAEHVFPGITHIDQLGKAEKTWWLLVSGKILRGDERYIEALTKVFQPGVDAEVADLLERQEFDFADKRRRAAMEEVERLNREAREDKKLEAYLRRESQRGDEDKERHDQHITERRSRWKNSRVKEWLAMGMATITFVCALVAFVVGIFSGDGWVLGGSCGASVVALVTLVKLLLSDQNGLATGELTLSPAAREAPAPTGA